MNDVVLPRNIVTDIKRLTDKVVRLERATRTVLNADAGGLAWTAGNPAWIDPATQTAWVELRVTNTDDGSHIFRNCGGQWKQITT